MRLPGCLRGAFHIVIFKQRGVVDKAAERPERRRRAAGQIRCRRLIAELGCQCHGAPAGGFNHRHRLFGVRRRSRRRSL